jgi:hypothetical protein
VSTGDSFNKNLGYLEKMIVVKWRKHNQFWHCKFMNIYSSIGVNKNRNTAPNGA